jgi:hypothetical protein
MAKSTINERYVPPLYTKQIQILFIKKRGRDTAGDENNLSCDACNTKERGGTEVKAIIVQIVLNTNLLQTLVGVTSWNTG